jgi:hypothetical protein
VENESVKYLVNRQLDASVRDDSQQVGHVTSVKTTNSFSLINLDRSVRHAPELARPAQRQPRLKHLDRDKTKKIIVETLTSPVLYYLLYRFGHRLEDGNIGELGGDVGAH